MSGRRIVVDATVGSGGHAEALLDAGAATVVGIDRDEQALALARVNLARFGERFRPTNARFSELSKAVKELGFDRAGGVLFDLGVSSMQLDRAERGFAYRQAGPLDMRMGPGEQDRPTAYDVVNRYPEVELARVIYEYGGERRSRRVAAAIARERAREPIATTDRLAAIVARAVGRRPGASHPARRTFQAIRIEVNAEIEELAASLPQAASLLEAGGRLVVISYHSLEDRTVKRFLLGDSSLRILTRSPVRPTEVETSENPRARSAKLRAAERLPEAA